MIYRTAESRAVLKEYCIATGCESCGRTPPKGIRCEPHHAFLRVGGAGSDFMLNIISLCRICHHAGESTTQANARLKEIIARRERTNVADIEWALKWIRRLDRHASEARIASLLEELPTEPKRLAILCLREAGCVGETFTGATEHEHHETKMA